MPSAPPAAAPEDEDVSPAAAPGGGAAAAAADDGDDQNDAANGTASAAGSGEVRNGKRKKPPPPYASRDYWEDRYAKQLKQQQQQQQQQHTSNQGKGGDEEGVAKKDADDADKEGGGQEKGRGQPANKAAADGDGGAGRRDEEPEVAKAPPAASSSSSLAAAAAATEDDSSTPLPYHSWYFTYDELRPIIMPLVLGGRREVREIIAKAAEAIAIAAVDGDGSDSGNSGSGAAGTGGGHKKAGVAPASGSPSAQPAAESDVRDTAEKERDAADGGGKRESDPDARGGGGYDDEPEEGEHDSDEDDDDEFVEIEEGDDSSSDEEDEVEREGLATHGPISVLEVGCGDVPLGAGFAVELGDLQLDAAPGAPSNPRSIVRRILCTDYSRVVVDMMKRRYVSGGGGGERTGGRNDGCDAKTVGTTTASVATATESNEKGDELAQIDVGDVPLEFEIADARNLPYEDASFELILEKGTLDAMLADKQDGCENCVQIVSECARVLRAEPSGFLVVISHLNAHTPNGIQWLEEVIFKGLTKDAAQRIQYTWEIEVHGGEPPAEDEDDGSQAYTRGPPRSAGPAVYVIHKKKKTKELQQSNCSAEAGKKSQKQGDDDKQTIAVKFFAY